MNIQIVLFDGFGELVALAPFEVLKRATSGVDLALWIIERFAGASIAAAVEHRMEYERRGVVWRA